MAPRVCIGSLSDRRRHRRPPSTRSLILRLTFPARSRLLGERPPYHHIARTRLSRVDRRKWRSDSSLRKNRRRRGRAKRRKQRMNSCYQQTRKQTLYHILSSWRREWDSNPRYGFPYTRFPSERLKPLGHPSEGCLGNITTGGMVATERRESNSDGRRSPALQRASADQYQRPVLRGDTLPGPDSRSPRSTLAPRASRKSAIANLRTKISRSEPGGTLDRDARFKKEDRPSSARFIELEV